jgi:hypothetical protein
MSADFFVIADADPGLLPRLIGQIAKRGLVPLRFSAGLAEDRQSLEIQFSLSGLPAITIAHLKEVIAVTPGVSLVRTV